VSDKRVSLLSTQYTQVL